MNPIILLITTSLIPVGASLFFYRLFQTKRYENLSYRNKQIIIGIVFGLISSLGTEFGVPINGAVMNVRDAAPLCAGLIFGAPAGIIAGLIGGIERWFAVYWGAGEYTRLACSISTCLIGIIAGFTKKQLHDNHIPDWADALVIAIVCEVLHMLMIFITNMEDIKVAFNYVELCSIPMITINSLAVALSVSLVTSWKRSDHLDKKKKTPYLSTQFQKILLVVVVVGFIITASFFGYMQNKISTEEIEDLLRLNIKDVVEDVKSQSDEALLRINRLVVEEIKTRPDVSLDELKERYNIVEIDIINQYGLITKSTERENLYFNMASGLQSKEFLCLLDGTQEYVQEYRPSARDPNLYRKYSGIAIENGFIQVAYGEQQFKENMADHLSNVVSHRHIGETGNMIVSDDDGNIISSSVNDIDSSDYDIRLNPEDTEDMTVYKAVIDGEDYYYMFTTAEGFRIYAVLPVKEADFSKKLSTYLLQFMQTLVSGALFASIYFVIKKLVVDNVREINTSLTDITEGKLDTIVDVRENREFESLSDGINTTVDSLKHFIAEANQRIDNELQYARDIQLSALPSNFHAVNELEEFDLYALMDPAKQVGGDFYDFYLMRHTLVFLVADVAGKGIPASLFMMRAKAILKSYAENNISIADIFTNANYELCQGNDAGMFVTSWMGFLNLDTGELKYVNAGHNKPLLRRKDSTFEYLGGPSGFILGGMEGIVYKQQSLMLEPGDELFLYTDGVVEATNLDKELYGDDRLKRHADSCIGMNAYDICNSIKADVEKFYEGAEQFDDITELSVQFKQYHKHR